MCLCVPVCFLFSFFLPFAGVIVLTCGFLAVGYLLMNCSLVTRYRESFYRETASGTYKGALFPVAHFLIEIPWLVGLSLLVRCSAAPLALPSFVAGASDFVFSCTPCCEEHRFPGRYTPPPPHTHTRSHTRTCDALVWIVLGLCAC